MSEPINLVALAEHALERTGERLVLNFEGDKHTNRELWDRSRRLQRAFAELGLAKDKIAVLFMINHPVVYPVFQGIFRTGATAVPVMFQATPAELRYVIEDTRAEIVFTDAFCLDRAREATAGLDFVRHLVVLGGTEDADRAPPEQPLEPFLAGDPATSLPKIAADDVAMLLYTSGTTGKSKGVMLTHENLLASARAAHSAHELEQWEWPRIGLSAMPMAHIFGVAVMNDGYMTPEHLANRAWSVQMRWFEPQKFLSYIQEHQVTTMAAVPTMLALLLGVPNLDQYDVSSLREVVCGAAPLSPELARAFMDRFGCFVREIYGMTENAGIATANLRSLGFRPGSAGKPYFNCELRIVDDADQPLGPGQRGEIVTRGAATMKGYFHRPKETAETMRGGWLHTGDIGYVDQEGFVYVVDRKKDMIIRGGENIYPAELEDALYKLAGVGEAAVVGVPDPVFGEKVVAFAVPRPGASLSEEAILTHLQSLVTKFKLPSRVYVVERLPKAGVGKILRRELREEAKRLDGKVEPETAPAPAATGYSHG